MFARYFNDRYQTYGRYVHLWGYLGPQFTQADVIQRRRADAQAVDAKLRPFATVPINANPLIPYLEETSSRGIVGITYDAFNRSLYRGVAPHQWSVAPDHEDQAALTASYICTKLKDEPARHSGNVIDLNRSRVFGIAFTESPREPQYAELKDQFKSELEKRCGIRIAAEAGASEVFQEGQTQAPGGVARLRGAEVTTVITPALAVTVRSFTLSASAAGWYPEWFVPGRRGLTGPDRGTLAKLFPQDQWAHAFGVSYAPRWGELRDQYWYAAYQEACPGCTVGTPYDVSIYYDALQTLFHGIQAAGPRLTTQSFDKGMHAIPARRSLDPFIPSAYFTAGNYSYIKDAMEIWWDPSGRAPGSEGSPGCYRLPHGGERVRAGEWRDGDNDVFQLGQPCNGDAPVAS